MLIRILLVLLVSSSTALAADPWTDDSYPVDKEDHIAILEEFRDAHKSIYFRMIRLNQAGAWGGTTDQAAEAGGAYFEAESRLAWHKGDFDKSYRYAQYAAMKSDECALALEQMSASGAGRGGSIVALLVAQSKRAQRKLVVLRYQGEAKRRGLNIKPATVEEMQAVQEQLWPTLPRPQRANPTEVPHRRFPPTPNGRIAE